MDILQTPVEGGVRNAGPAADQAGRAVHLALDIAVCKDQVLDLTVEDADESRVFGRRVDPAPVAENLVVAVEHNAFRSGRVVEIDIDRRPFRDGGHIDVVHQLEIGHTALDDLAGHSGEVSRRLDQVRIGLGAGAFPFRDRLEDDLREGVDLAGDEFGRGGLDVGHLLAVGVFGRQREALAVGGGGKGDDQGRLALADEDPDGAVFIGRIRRGDGPGGVVDGEVTAELLAVVAGEGDARDGLGALDGDADVGGYMLELQGVAALRIGDHRGDAVREGAVSCGLFGRQGDDFPVLGEGSRIDGLERGRQGCVELEAGGSAGSGDGLGNLSVDKDLVPGAPEDLHVALEGSTGLEDARREGRPGGCVHLFLACREEAGGEGREEQYLFHTASPIRTRHHRN